MSLANDLISKCPDFIEFEKYIVKADGENCKWGRLVCKWTEKKGGDDTLEHIFTPLVNLQTGKIYSDCSKKKIYVKFLAHTILRPFHILFKTVYHLAIPISIPIIIAETCEKGIKEKKTKGEIAKACLLNSARSLADIVRTPLYGIAMTVVNIAALIIGPFAPKCLYDLRELTGKLVQSLNRSEEPVDDDFFRCFQEILTLENIYLRNKLNDDTIYSPQAPGNIIGLNNLARANVRYLRANYVFCNNPFGKLGYETSYTSASYASVEKAGFVYPKDDI